MTYDYLVVGAGLYGSVFARIAAEHGKTVHVIDKRNHVAGNCYTSKVEGIDVHHYGPHIFHTNNLAVWDFVNRFTKFNHYRHHVKARNLGKTYSFPINLMTLQQVWGVGTPAEAERKLAEVTKPCKDPKNLREWCVSQVGEELYQLFVEGYTAKQWGRDPGRLPASIIRRLPIRLTYNDCYFDDQFQGIPVDGYTKMFDNMLDHDNIKVETGVDFLSNRKDFKGKVIYTGKIDEYYEYRYGELEYRSLTFQHRVVDGDFQGVSQMNYTGNNVPFTRIIEHKHFTFKQSPKSVITYEHPVQHTAENEAFYPVRDEVNVNLHAKYAGLADENTVFCGRLGSFQYHDMHQIVAAAMNLANKEAKKLS